MLQFESYERKNGWTLRASLKERKDGRTVTIGLLRPPVRLPGRSEAAAELDAAVEHAVNMGWEHKRPSRRLKALGRSIHEPRIYDPKLGR